jgi:hypothetical protein
MLKFRFIEFSLSRQSQNMSYRQVFHFPQLGDLIDAPKHTIIQNPFLLNLIILSTLFFYFFSFFSFFFKKRRERWNHQRDYETISNHYRSSHHPNKQGKCSTSQIFIPKNSSQIMCHFPWNGDTFLKIVKSYLWLIHH